jgi:hypothetical protein
MEKNGIKGNSKSYSYKKYQCPLQGRDKIICFKIVMPSYVDQPKYRVGRRSVATYLESCRHSGPDPFEIDNFLAHFTIKLEVSSLDQLWACVASATLLHSQQVPLPRGADRPAQVLSKERSCPLSRNPAAAALLYSLCP